MVRHLVAEYWEIKDKYKSSNPVPKVTNREDDPGIERPWTFLREI